MTSSSGAPIKTTCAAVGDDAVEMSAMTSLPVSATRGGFNDTRDINAAIKSLVPPRDDRVFSGICQVDRLTATAELTAADSAELSR